MTSAAVSNPNAVQRQSDAKSPLSEQPPAFVRDLPRKFLLDQLRRYYHSAPPATAVECDYTLWRCAETGLEFAWPLRPAEAGLYAWLSQFPSYYPGDRWDYHGAHRLIQHGSHPATILDVGCGAGDFLRGFPGLPANAKYALDFNETAVAACRAQGFNAFCGTVEAALQAGFLPPGGMPVVTAFHCLEHVADPIAFIRALRRVTAPGGRIYVSTPYSPMSFETEWFDVLNHPPHHMTRWNLAAYRKLGDLLNLKLRWTCPHSGAAKRALTVFRLLQYGPHHAAGKGRLVVDLVRHLPRMVRLFRQQLQRGQAEGVVADVILVEFTVPKDAA